MSDASPKTTVRVYLRISSIAHKIFIDRGDLVYRISLENVRYREESYLDRVTRHRICDSLRPFDSGRCGVRDDISPSITLRSLTLP